MRLTLAGFYRDMAGGTAVALVLLAAAVAFSPVAWPLALLLALLWSAAPAIALWVSQGRRRHGRAGRWMRMLWPWASAPAAIYIVRT